MPVPEYPNIKTMAQELDCSETTVTDYTNRGLLPQPYRKGSLVRWKWAEVVESMEVLSASKDTASIETDPILRAINGS